MVTEQYAAGALDGSVDPEELTTLLAQENQDLLSTVAQLKAENAELAARMERNREMWQGQVMRQAEQLVELRRDAERYRWLRNSSMFGTRHDPAVLKEGPSDCCEFYFGEELDVAVDESIGAQQWTT